MWCELDNNNKQNRLFYKNLSNNEKKRVIKYYIKKIYYENIVHTICFEYIDNLAYIILDEFNLSKTSNNSKIQNFTPREYH